MKQIKLALLLTFITFIPCFATSPHNLLPRLPQIVFDKGTSDMFSVEELSAKADMELYNARTELNIKLKNISQKQINIPIKFRVLYPTGKNPVKVSINKKTIKYNQENPVTDLKLSPGEITDISIQAYISTDYSINNIKKAIAAQQKQNKTKLQSVGESFARYFNQEVYGTRFMVGVLVSKWGIFPVNIKHAKIEINTGSDMIHISEKPDIWKQLNHKKGKKFVCESTEGFETTVFLPSKDESAFKENLELIKELKK